MDKSTYTYALAYRHMVKFLTSSSLVHINFPIIDVIDLNMDGLMNFDLKLRNTILIGVVVGSSLV